jgi:hypothetical protein
VPVTTLLINPCHCRDGRKVRCRTCHKVWRHDCESAADGGCEWTCLSPHMLGQDLT